MKCCTAITSKYMYIFPRPVIFNLTTRFVWIPEVRHENFALLTISWRTQWWSLFVSRPPSLSPVQLDLTAPWFPRRKSNLIISRRLWLLTTTVSDSRETWGATQCSYIRNNGQWTPLDTIGHHIGQFYIEQWVRLKVCGWWWWFMSHEVHITGGPQVV